MADMKAIMPVSYTHLDVYKRQAYYDSTAYDNAEDTMPTLGSDNGLTLADLTGKAYDDPMWDQLLDQMSFEDMSLLVNLGGWQTAQILSLIHISS